METSASAKRPRRRIAFISTGGTISWIGKDSLDIIDYAAQKTMMDAHSIVEYFPEIREVADVIPITYRTIPSTAIDFNDWRELVLLCHELAKSVPAYDGIIIGHGTASLEETAYALSLTLKIDLPVVITGAQRPASALSSDAGLNLVNAARVAASGNARGLGVLVVLNDEIQAARDVTKQATTRLHAFHTPTFGILGDVDGEDVHFYRRPLRRVYPDTEFDLSNEKPLPRVDIVYAYAGADGVAVEAFVKARARGLIAAGFAPGFNTPAQSDALRAASEAGVTVVQSCRAGSGRVPFMSSLAENGFIAADNLTPQKARILLALALATTNNRNDVARMFKEY